MYNLGDQYMYRKRWTILKPFQKKEEIAGNYLHHFSVYQALEALKYYIYYESKLIYDCPDLEPLCEFLKNHKEELE